MWFAAGLIIGAGFIALAVWLNGSNIQMRWYYWLLALLGILLIAWAIHDYYASIAEFNEIAAWTLLWLLGIPGVILLVLAGWLPLLKLRKQSRK